MKYFQIYISCGLYTYSPRDCINFLSLVGPFKVKSWTQNHKSLPEQWTAAGFHHDLIKSVSSAIRRNPTVQFTAATHTALQSRTPHTSCPRGSAPHSTVCHVIRSTIDRFPIDRFPVDRYPTDWYQIDWFLIERFLIDRYRIIQIKDTCVLRPRARFDGGLSLCDPLMWQTAFKINCTTSQTATDAKPVWLSK